MYVIIIDVIINIHQQLYHTCETIHNWVDSRKVMMRQVFCQVFAAVVMLLKGLLYTKTGRERFLLSDIKQRRIRNIPATTFFL